MKTALRFQTLGLILLGFVLANAGGPVEPVSAAAIHEVRAEGMKFAPATLTIAVSDIVRFVVKDEIPHAPISGTKGQGAYYVPTKRFYTGVVKESGGTAEVSFKEAGEYLYFCALHPFMQGKVIVK